MKTLRIEVTAEDIATGVRVDPWSCPLARAIMRAIGRGYEAAVGGQVTYYRLDAAQAFGRVAEAALPSEASTFRRMFDNGNAVEPFVFDLEVPE